MTFDDYLNYWFLFFPIAIIVIGYSMFDNYFNFHNGLTILFLSLLFIALGLFSFFFILMRLIANNAFITIPNDKMLDVDKFVDNLKCKINLSSINVNKELKAINAVTKVTAFSWGEELTIIFDDAFVLINSRPNSSNQPITIFKDKKNISLIKQIL